MTSNADAGGLELLHVTRGGLLESRHRGSVVLLAASGDVEHAVGDVEAPMFPRSSLKPLQTVAMLEAGLHAPQPSVALASASHVGEPAHLAGAREVLAAAGLDEAALGCPPDLPLHRPAMLEWVHAGGGPARICHNCSGKHAAMLATCVAAGWDTGAYLDASHPLQQAVTAQVERLSGARVAATSVDGCGAPALAIPLVALARSFARLTTAPGGTSERAVADAMRAHPQLVSGTDTPATELMASTPGLLAKNGAEGVWAAALPDGRAFAVKVDDGAGRALGPLLAVVLRFWGADDPVVRRWEHEPALGGGRPVGSVSPSPALLDLLGLPALADLPAPDAV
ncbi:asparaginase [uncultured Jatrophihabitans sp.]|uniref:asparaginase n=1 Tax=uncultured Jatrophihabitans sp. TaxID=1610747 RepID=UPI0035CA45B3